MELRRIRYFLAVANELHFGRAAEKLHIAQPPLSEQIRKLEDELGVKLFARTSRKVSLTDAGRIFLTGAQQAMDAIDRAALSASQAQRGESGHLILGFASSAAMTVMPPVLRYLKEQLPGLKLTLRQFSRASLASEALVRGELDLAIIRPTQTAGIDRHVILEDPLVAALWKGHPLAGKGPVDLTSFKDEGFILFPPSQGSTVGIVVENICERSGFLPTPAHYVDNVYTMLGLVAANAGVALVPLSLNRLKMEDIEFCEIVNSDVNFDLVLCWGSKTNNLLLENTIKKIIDCDLKKFN